MTTVFCPEEIYGIIGHPLGHSMSPMVHNWGFQHHGLPKVYLRWPVTPQSLPGFMQGVRAMPVSGLSVTIPHKQAVMAFVDEVEPAAREIGAVNTLYWRQGRLLGTNTDINGFMAPLLTEQGRLKSAVVLGAGGAARAALIGLKQLGLSEVRVTARSDEKSGALADELGVGMLKWQDRSDAGGDILVNTTPLGMAGTWQDASPCPDPKALSAFGTVYDLVYNPQVTRLLAEAEQAGCRTISGLSMFVHQAADQFRLWTGLDLPFQEAALLVARALDPRP